MAWEEGIIEYDILFENVKHSDVLIAAQWPENDNNDWLIAMAQKCQKLDQFNGRSMCIYLCTLLSPFADSLFYQGVSSVNAETSSSAMQPCFSLESTLRQ